MWECLLKVGLLQRSTFWQGENRELSFERVGFEGWVDACRAGQASALSRVSLDTRVRNSEGASEASGALRG